MKTLLAGLLLLGSVAWAEPGDSLGPWVWENLPEYAAVNFQEIIRTSGHDIRSTLRGNLTNTPEIEGRIQINESGDFTHTQWVSAGVRGGFVNGVLYTAPATLISISDAGEVIWFNPTGKLHSSTRGLLGNFAPYEIQSSLDVNSAGQYTYATGYWPIYNIWRSGLGNIGQGSNPRINNAGTVCWTGIVLGRNWPVCDGEPVDFDMGRPPVPNARMYSPVRMDFFDLTDDEILVQKVWSSPLASAHTGGDTILYHVVRLPLSRH